MTLTVGRVVPLSDAMLGESMRLRAAENRLQFLNQLKQTVRVDQTKGPIMQVGDDRLGALYAFGDERPETISRRLRELADKIDAGVAKINRVGTDSSPVSYGNHDAYWFNVELTIDYSLRIPKTPDGDA